MDERLKALEEKFTINDSENNEVFYKRNLFEAIKEIYAINKVDVCHTDDIWSLDYQI